VEGVVDALRRIHALLVPNGLLIDTQPVSARPPVTVGGGELGTLDMREWSELIDAVDERVAQSVSDGLWATGSERRFVVSDSFETGQEMVETVKDWQGARVPPELAKRLAAGAAPAQVHQEVRLRVLKRL
jgi:hypothetical protein